MDFNQNQRAISLMKAAAVLLALSLAGASSGAIAQDSTTKGKGDCVARPTKDHETTFSGKLDDCNSVLAPPKVGDGEIVSPTPETGTMRVIKPSGVPLDKNP
ncbi:hypothetical protein [Rhizobium herbae]